MAHRHDSSRDRLLKRRAELAGGIVPLLEELLEGSLFRRSRRCGKSYCHCSRGKGHPGWHLGILESPGKIRQTTLPEAMIPMVKVWVKNYRTVRKVLKEISAINRSLLKLERTESASNGKAGQ